MSTTEDYTVRASPFPAKTQTATARINHVETTATSIYFADKIMITISQDGRLAHWVHVPLDISTTDNLLSSSSYPPSFDDADQIPDSDLLPMTHLTATAILGGTIPEIDTMGQLLATQIASAIVTRDAREKRMVVVGMGLDKSVVRDAGGRGRERYANLVGLVLEVL